MKDLKECPFCGSEAVIYEIGEGWFIDCGNRKSTCSHVPEQQEGCHMKEDAIKKWNTRTSIPISKIEELLSRSWIASSSLAEFTSDEVVSASNLRRIIDEAKNESRDNKSSCQDSH